jgi:hypothetical protein
MHQQEFSLNMWADIAEAMIVGSLLSHPYVIAAILPQFYIKHSFGGIARCEYAHQDSFMAYA